VLLLGISHKKAAALITLLVTLVTVSASQLVSKLPVTWSMVASLVIFLSVAGLLVLNRRLFQWRDRLRRMELER